MKTLKEILQLEVYEPKSPDEKRFKDKHVVVKHKDANGNDDDLFNAKNIKTVDREPKHGYNPGEDEKVYEEVEELDEKFMNVYAVATAQVKKKYGLKGKNVDLTDKQTVEAHALAKKIAKKMGINLKESARAFQQAYKKTMVGGDDYNTAGVRAVRSALKSGALIQSAMDAAKNEPPSTHERMMRQLGVDQKNPVTGPIGKKK
jgi:flavodoxin